MQNRTEGPKHILYLSSSHWDREWYQTHQEFRFRLVDIMNEVLDVLEQNPDFGAFVTDGQTILLDDYIEIMPNARPRMEKLIREERIIVGPWYTMPDENLSSGESLIRNLKVGHTTGEKYGSKRILKCGFVCDIFGHVAQLPQILKGFNIGSALLGRGTSQRDCPAFFTWEAPSGDSVTTFKVPEACGYGTFWYDVYFIGYVDKNNKKSLNERAEEYVEREMDRSPVPYAILMDNMDHTPIHAQAPDIAAYLAKKFNCPVSFGVLDTFIEEAAKSGGNLPVKRGELQETGELLGMHHMLIPGTLSSRYDLKQYNDKCQNDLEKKALPMAALAALYGKGIPLGYFNAAYKHLLQNHAHDSICGCSIDRVGKDMHYRFRQAEEIAKEATDKAASFLLPLTPGGDTKEMVLTLFNPLPFPVSSVVTADIPFPLDYPAQFDDMIPSEMRNIFHIYDAQGKEIPYQKLSNTNHSMSYVHKGAYGSAADIYTVAMEANLPPMGYAQYKVIPAEVPVRHFGSLRTKDMRAENEHLVLEIEQDGTATLTHKETGYVYPNLLSFADSGDTGDGWHYRAPDVAKTVYSNGFSTEISCIYDGPLSCTFSITKYMMLPQGMDYHRQYTRRETVAAQVKVETRLTLSKGQQGLGVEILVDNVVRDHRMVLQIPTGILADTYFADQAFCFVERPTGRNEETRNWKEPEKEEKAFGSIVYKKREDGSGLAFISKGGMHECAAPKNDTGNLNVTLFRTFSKTYRTDGEPDGQLLYPLTFEGVVFPIGKGHTQGDLVRAKDALASGMLHYAQASDAALKPSTALGFALESDTICLSLLEPDENNEGVLLRVVNYCDQAATGKLTCPRDIKACEEVNLLGEPIRSADFSANAIEIALGAYQIRTYHIML